MKRKEKIDNKKETTQDFVNVKDIKDKFLYKRDEKIISYIQINIIEINLLSKREKQSLVRTLTAELTSERKTFKFRAVSRPVYISPLLTENKIVRLCNLINNPAYINIEDTSFESSMPFLKS